MTMRRCVSPLAALFTSMMLPVAGNDALALDRIAWIEDLGLRSERPLVSVPPAAGAVIGIDERRAISSYTQILTLAGDGRTVGENSVTVTVTRDGLAPRLDEATLFSEMRTRIPAGMPMAVGPPGLHNVFGIFGAATGTRGSSTCLYGWQSVNLADAWITTESSSIFDENHSLSIRVRICRTGVAAEQLVAAMQALQPGMVTAPDIPAQPLGGYDALSTAANVVGAGSRRPAETADDEPSLRAVDDDTRPAAAPTHARAARRARPHQRALEPSTLPDPTPPRSPLAGMPTIPLPP